MRESGEESQWNARSRAGGGKKMVETICEDWIGEEKN